MLSMPADRAGRGVLGRANDRKWLCRLIGEILFIDTSKLGVDIPPVNSSLYGFVKLTASDAYNTGKLGSESVSGSAPLVLATAVIIHPKSPMKGQTIDLLNSEGRILRPSTSAGTKQNDQMQQITGSATAGIHSTASIGLMGPYSGAISALSGYNAAAPNLGAGGVVADGIAFDSANSPNARAGTETRMKNVGVTAFMRIF